MECLVLNDISCQERRPVSNVLYTEYNEPYPNAYAPRSFHGSLSMMTGTSSVAHTRTNLGVCTKRCKRERPNYQNIYSRFGESKMETPTDFDSLCRRTPRSLRHQPGQKNNRHPLYQFAFAKWTVRVMPLPGPSIGSTNWCGRGDSDSQAFRHFVLSEACLPFHHNRKDGRPRKICTFMPLRALALEASASAVPPVADLKMVVRGGIEPPSHRVRSAVPFPLDQQTIEDWKSHSELH